MTSPVVSLVINPRSRRKYNALTSVIEHVRIVLEDARLTVAKLEGQAPSSGRAASPEQLVALVKHAEESLEALQDRVRRGQAELMAQDWRY